MKAELVFHEKRILIHQKSNKTGIAEIKIWKIPKSPDYPEARKFSLFLSSQGKVVFGIDNHKPKGPHLHEGDKEKKYHYVDEEKLMGDFWNLVREKGFKS